jgi:hypothetical protein
MFMGDNVIRRIEDVRIVTIKINDILRSLSLSPGMDAGELTIENIPMQENTEDRKKEKQRQSVDGFFADRKAYGYPRVIINIQFSVYH